MNSLYKVELKSLFFRIVSPVKVSTAAGLCYFADDDDTVLCTYFNLIGMPFMNMVFFSFAFFCAVVVVILEYCAPFHCALFFSCVSVSVVGLEREMNRSRVYDSLQSKKKRNFPSLGLL